MKQFLISIAVVTLSLTFTTPLGFAKGQGGGGGAPVSSGGGRGGSGFSHGPVGGGGAHFSAAPRHYSASGWRGRPYYHPSAVYGTRATGSRKFSYPAVRSSVNRTARIHVATTHTNSALSSRHNQNTRHRAAATGYSSAANAGKWSHSNRIGSSRLDPQTSARLRNWSGRRDNFAQARLKHDDHYRHHHDRSWWRHHCAAIIFFDWGFWAWDAGWWYPAWGYDPYYSYYEYNEPIYGYDGLPPDQVVANVQGALQQLGYYQDAVDGIIGPLTRAAIADYQRDNGLPITSAIDEPLLVSLGFIAP